MRAAAVLSAAKRQREQETTALQVRAARSPPMRRARAPRRRTSLPVVPVTQGGAAPLSFIHDVHNPFIRNHCHSFMMFTTVLSATTAPPPGRRRERAARAARSCLGPREAAREGGAGAPEAGPCLNGPRAHSHPCPRPELRPFPSWLALLRRARRHSTEAGPSRRSGRSARCSRPSTRAVPTPSLKAHPPPATVSPRPSLLLQCVEPLSIESTDCLIPSVCRTSEHRIHGLSHSFSVSNL